MASLIDQESLAVATIWQEARGESYEGKVAVARVIRNRMERKYNSDGTIAGTVLKPYQFSGWNTNDPNRIPAIKLDDTDPVVKECQAAWLESASAHHSHFTPVLYHTQALRPKPRWAVSDKVRQVEVIGNHIFYDEDG